MKGDIVELDEQLIVMSIPKDAIKIKMTVTLLDADNEPYKVKSVMKMHDIHKAREEYLELDPDDGVRYVVTDLFKAYIDDDEGMDWEESRDAYGSK